MSLITFQCMSCDGDFDVAYGAIIERPTVIKCSHCGARPAAVRCESFATSLEDLFASISALRSKVHFELNIDSEDLPPPFGQDGGATESSGFVSGSNLEDDDEDEDEDDDDEDDEDDDDDFDDFDDFDDDDDDDEDDDDEDEY